MRAILKRELFIYTSSFKAITISLFIYLSTALSSYFFSRNFTTIQNHGAEVDITSSIKFFVFFLGPILVAAVFYDIFNKEIELRTIRLLITKTSLLKIFLGKILAAFLFWLLTLTVSYFLVYLSSGKIYFQEFMSSISCILLSLSVVVCFSILFDRGNQSLLVSILMGIVFPVLGLISSMSDTWYWSMVHAVIPYYANELTLGLLLVPFIAALILFCLSYFILQRKDY